MGRRLNTYAAFSVGCFLVWAAILAIYATHTLTSSAPIGLIFAGWVLGWLSATIARSIYPPPTRQRASADR